MAKLMLIIGFVIAFTAGMVIGLQIQARQALAVPPTSRPSHHDGWLTSELGLTSVQEEQLKKIWSETAHRGGREQDDKRRQLRGERDKAIAALIQPQDKDKYDQVMKAYTEQSGAIDKEWRSSFQNAVERTKEILTPEQRAKYDEILKRHESERGSRDQNRRTDDSATSRPAVEK